MKLSFDAASVGAILILASSCNAPTASSAGSASGANGASGASGASGAAGSSETSTAPANDAAYLYDDLGTHHREIMTKSVEAQRYFDQGLILAFAFNHDEAIRSFTEATRIDPTCAMAWWGIAL